MRTEAGIRKTVAVPGRRVVIIAHSSMSTANEGMVRHGADCAVAKKKGMCPSPTVLQRFATYAEIQELMSHIRGA